ncbi:MAG TPA: LLM class F420-dependent oxidoreductase [Candidatus Bathyarchaeia archaeon]|nr:LLM class F420-dependent oxidoreductase [Candidatus Bathyarchaeia archaeon]
MAQSASRPLRFGIQTPQEGASFDALALHWREAERLGYDTVWLDDHFYGVVTPPESDQLESWVTMAALARETSTIRFGTLVGCNSYRNPSLVAKMAASLDVISGGRLELGLGAGWYQGEYEAYGYEFPAIGKRLAQLAEALEICRRMWQDERASFAGRHYRVDAAWNNPKPLQKPHPPIMIGGGGEKVLLKLVARHAQAWNMGGSPQDFRHKIEVLDAHCRALGRDPGEIERSWFGPLIIDEDEERLAQRLRKRAERSGGAAIDARTIVGTPPQVVARIREFAALGVTHFIAMFGRVDDLRATRLFAERVIPAFR